MRFGLKRAAVLAGISSVALAVGTSGAVAGAFGLREQGAQGQGMSFAGVAAGSGGLSSMYWNPATITMNPGWQSYVSGSLINLDARITTLPGTSPLLGTLPSGQIGELAAVPSTYTSMQLSDTVWVGLSSNAPFGLVTKPNATWGGQLYARTSRVFSANFNPIMGLKLTDWLSVAAGPTIEYIDARLKRAASFVPGASNVLLRGDDVEFGYTVGATLTPMAGTTIGVGYRSSIGHELKGRLQSPTAFIPITASLNTPDLLTVGVTQAVTNEFRVNAGYEFSNWSRLGTVPLVAYDSPVAGAVVRTLPLNYKDGHFASFGAEYDLSQQFTVRAGGAYEWSPIRTAVRTPAIPDANRVWASVGASYRWSDMISFDVAYSHVFADNARINIVQGNPSLERATIPGLGSNIPLNFVGVAKGSVDIFSAAVRLRLDDPRVAQPALVARY